MRTKFAVKHYVNDTPTGTKPRAGHLGSFLLALHIPFTDYSCSTCSRHRILFSIQLHHKSDNCNTNFISHRHKCFLPRYHHPSLHLNPNRRDCPTRTCKLCNLQEKRKQSQEKLKTFDFKTSTGRKAKSAAGISMQNVAMKPIYTPTPL